MLRRKPLFPGHNVYHQIDLISNFVGTPSASASAKIRNKKARDYLKNLPRKARADWSGMFPSTDAVGLDLMEKLLAFDPAERITAAEAVRHPFFAAFQSAVSNAPKAPPPRMMREEFLWEDEKQLSKAELRAVLYDEILRFHPEHSSAKDVRYEPTSGADVKSQMRAVGSGDAPRSSSHSMPSAQTQSLYETARREHDCVSPCDEESGSSSAGSEGECAMVPRPHDYDPTETSDDMCVEESPRAGSWSASQIVAARELAASSYAALGGSGGAEVISGRELAQRYSQEVRLSQERHAADDAASVYEQYAAAAAPREPVLAALKPVRAALKQWKKKRGCGTSSDALAMRSAGHANPAYSTGDAAAEAGDEKIPFAVRGGAALGEYMHGRMAEEQRSASKGDTPRTAAGGQLAEATSTTASAMVMSTVKPGRAGVFSPSRPEGNLPQSAARAKALKRPEGSPRYGYSRFSEDTEGVGGSHDDNCSLM